jgi:hypothetical protein
MTSVGLFRGVGKLRGTRTHSLLETCLNMSYCTITSDGFLKFERRHDVPLFSRHHGRSVRFAENHTIFGTFRTGGAANV